MKLPRELKINNQKVLKWLKIAGITVAILFAALYIFHQIYQHSYTRIITEQALNVEISDDIEAIGITVRNETPVENSTSGVIVSAVTKGRKVSKGEPLAYSFRSREDAEAYERIEEIKTQISEFKSMETAGEESAVDAASLDKLLAERLNALSKAVNEGNLAAVDEIKSDITYILNKRQIYMKKTDNFDVRVQALTAEKNELEDIMSKSPKTINAKFSGYFVGSVDGYEKLLTVDAAKKLTAEQLDEIMESAVDIDPDKYIGKIAEDYKWEILSIIPAKDAERLTVGNTYTIKLPYAEIGSIRATLQAINKGEDEDRVVVVFNCSYLVAELTSIRTQPIVIQVKTYSGIGIKTAALRTRKIDVEVAKSEADLYISESDMQSDSDGEEESGSDKVKVGEDYELGVYVLWGDEVIFRKVTELYSKDGVSVIKKDSRTSGYLKLYDEVIVEGKDLYAGKIINSR